jgi:hypothetical protein
MLSIDRISSALVTTIFAATVCVAGVTIDFETLPSGNPSPVGDPIADSYASWGVTFWSDGSLIDPRFKTGYNGQGVFCWVGRTSYPPGFNIMADFSVNVLTVSADVMTAAGYTVTMVAKDANGVVIDSVESGPAPPEFWVGTLTVTTNTPIASVEWWPSAQNASVGIDNLSFAGGCACVADLNGDCIVDLADLGILLADFGCMTPPGPCDGDINGDGVTDLTDLGILLADFGCGL